MNKQEFLKLVYENSITKTAFEQLKSQAEGDATRAAIDDVIGNFYDRVSSVMVYAQNNMEEINKIENEKGSDLINNKDSNGSTDDEQKA